MDLKGKKVVIMGAGKSGIAAAQLLDQVGAEIVLFDQNESLDIEELIKKIPPNIHVYAGELPQEEKTDASLLVMSPGIPVDTPFVESFRSLGIPVWGEIELAYRYSKGRLIAITGTNGKTTTTALTGHIMKDWYEDHGIDGKVYVVGNIGDPYTEIALKTGENDTVVLEVSSFQLETIEEFHPQISAILNITPDHLNRHHTMEAYSACKEAIAKNQSSDEFCILNHEDERLRAFASERLKAGACFFSSAGAIDAADKPAVNLYEEDGKIYAVRRDPGELNMGSVQRLMDIHDMKLLGTHNVENVMAAIAMCTVAGVPMERIISSVCSFDAVEHRIEYTATVNGVDYYNDSKGTNPDAAIKGIQAMVKKTVLIGGGYDKQSEYDEWIDSFDGKVTYLILLGQTAEKIKKCAEAHGFKNIVMVSDMEEAVKKAHELAGPGEAVLLSPACASWGMFKNYEERGRIFKELVRKLQ